MQDRGVSPEVLPYGISLPDAPALQRRRRRRRRIALAVGVFLLALFLLLCYVGVFGGNVRTVVPGRVYRSGQLTGSGLQPLSAQWIGHSLDNVLRSRHIHTVINLRGGSEQDPWYRAEEAACAQERAAHVDIPMSARFLPPPDRLRQLLHTFDHASYPILIHCSAGSDRTGLASAIYVHLYQHIPLDEAEAGQLTLRYGHVWFGSTRAMNDFFDLYRQTGSGLGLREWILTKYPALYADSPLKMPENPHDMNPSRASLPAP
jgi:hypothetical protein